MTSLTQRSSGLVQRRTEASRSAAAADKEWGAGGGLEDEGHRDELGDDEKGDSKETRLTLMEEVLLLGLKDREVRRPLKGAGFVEGLWGVLTVKGRSGEGVGDVGCGGDGAGQAWGNLRVWGRCWERGECLKKTRLLFST